jgi:hypothetical protein
MLQNTFIHIQSIGALTEQRLWESGLRHWDAFSDDISIPLSSSRKHLLKEGIGESKRHLYQGNPVYFSKLLASNQSWRFFPEYRDSMVYLDIENMLKETEKADIERVLSNLLDGSKNHLEAFNTQLGNP